MKILLVAPANPPSFWTYDAILPTLGKRCLYPNLALPTIAGLTPGEHEIVLVDENVEAIDFEAEADVVGVTGYICHAERVIEIADEFRRRGRFVAVGGPYATLCPEELRGHADVLFLGEAEATWARFLHDFDAGRPSPEYKAADLPVLDDPPMPRFDLIPVGAYHAMPVQFARGCPFRCEFCDIIVMYGRRPRAKPVDSVVREVAECHRLGARQVFIVDDNFIGDKKRAKALLRALGEWNRAQERPLVFNTEVSLNVAEDDELLELMRDAGFISVFIGIESPRKASLEETKKTQNLRGDLVEAVHRVQAHGLQVQAGMIVGFDADDSEIFEEQRRFVQDARIPVSMTGMLQALPQTPLYTRLLAEGRLVNETHGDAFVTSNIVPQRLSRLELHRGYRDLVRTLYEPRAFGERALAYLEHRGPRTTSRQRIRLADVVLFGRVMWTTVIRGGPQSARFTLGFLASALRLRPGAFSEAASLVLIYKGLSDFAALVVSHLDRAITELEKEQPLARVEYRAERLPSAAST